MRARVALAGTIFATAVAVVAPAAPAGATDISVTVTGVAAFPGGGGDVPIVGALVQLCDDDRVLGIGNDCDMFGETRTGADGSFSITGTRGDFEGPPDVYVRVIADNDGGSVEIEPGIGIKYCMADSPPRSDFTASALDVGTMRPSNSVACGGLGAFAPFADVAVEDAAWQLLESLRLVHGVAEDLVGGMNRVTVVWPHVGNAVPFYLPIFDTGQIRITDGFEGSREVFFHEYGHHVLYTKAESPLPDYNNGTCDEGNPLAFLPFFGGHCGWTEERGSIHWTEGFPNFFAEVVLEELDGPEGEDGVDIPTEPLSLWVEDDTFVSSETPWLDDGSSPSPEGNDNGRTELWTHAVLHDLWDLQDDDFEDDVNDAGDRVHLSFFAIWDVLQTDPVPAGDDHEHPTSLEEFRRLLVEASPELENRVNAVFAENGMPRPGADLGVSAVSVEGTTTVQRGSLLEVVATTFNHDDASVGTGETSHSGIYLDDHFTGSIEVDPLAPGEEATVTERTNILGSIPPGTYTLRVCADGFEEIYETDHAGGGAMVDNCATGPSVTVENRPPVADAGGPYTFEEGAGGTLSGEGSNDGDGDDLTFDWSGPGLIASEVGDRAFLRDDVDDGSYSVDLTVDDGFGGTDSDTAAITVTNVAPVVEAGGAALLSEGQLLSRGISTTDPGPDLLQATIDWGDGVTTTEPVNRLDTIFHRFTDDGTFTVEVCISDGDATGCDSFDATVGNVDPDLGDDPVTLAVDEGTSTAGTATFTDPGADTWSAGVAWGDGTTSSVADLTTRSVPLQHTYVQDGSYTGSLCVTDDDAGSDCTELQATVANVAPSVAPPEGADPTLALVTTSVSATFTDPGTADVHTATIDWGDGSPGTTPVALTEPSGAGPGRATASHTYATAGTFTVELCVRDDDVETCSQAPVVVLTPEQAAAAAVAALVARGSTDPAVLTAIGHLDGTIRDSASGALDKLASSDWAAAVTKLQSAVQALDAARTDESAVQAALTLIAEAVARQQLAAAEALGLTDRGALKQLASIRAAVVAGRAAYDGGRYVSAVGSYRTATKVAGDLLRSR